MRFQQNTIFSNPLNWLVSVDPLADLCFQACRPTTKAMPNVALRKSMKKRVAEWVQKHRKTMLAYSLWKSC